MTDSSDTTENSKNNGDNVDMDPHYENLAAYVLDALDQSDERESVERLIENDPAVASEYRELAEAAGQLAAGVPPIARDTRASGIQNHGSCVERIRS